MAGQEHTSAHRGHTTSTTWRQQADHSRAAESGGIHMHVWGRAKEHNAAGQRGTCQHSQPASHDWVSRAHNINHIAGGKPITHPLQNPAGSRCMCGVGRKKTKPASQRGTCQHSQTASHMEYYIAHNIHHMAGSKPITHQLQNQEGSRCMCGVGQKKKKQAGQRGTCQHSRPSAHME